MSGPLYPNVPYALGVPPVLRDALNSISAAEAQIPIDQVRADTSTGNIWGIYYVLGGLAVGADSVVALEWNREFRVADYPMEAGGFQSYNKVTTPFGNRLLVTKGGTVAEREEFLASLDKIAETTDLFNIVSPERTYLNVTFERLGLSRTATAGAALLSVELIVREVRQSVTASYSSSGASSTATQQSAQPETAPPPAAAKANTRTTSGRQRVNRGAVQSKPGPTFTKQEYEDAAKLGLKLVIE